MSLSLWNWRKHAPRDEVVNKYKGGRIRIIPKDDHVESRILNLPKDVQILIFRRLTSVYDRINFGAVCEEWKSLALVHPIQWTPNLAIPFEYPWLMYPHEKIQGMYNFYDPVANSMMHSVCIPQLENCKIRFSHQGWLLVTKPPTSIFFFEPFTRTRFPLPDLTHGLYDAFCFSTAPTSMDCEIFGISHSRMLTCHFRPGDYVGYIWSARELLHPTAISHPCFTNLVFDGQYFCYLAKDGTLVCFNKYYNPRDPIVKASSSSSTAFMSNYWRQFLVCSGDDMLSLWIHKMRDSIHVFKLDSQGDKWVEIKSVDKKSLYLSQTASLAVEAKYPRMRDTVQLCMFSEIHGHDKDNNISFSLEDHNFYIYNGAPSLYLDALKSADYPILNTGLASLENVMGISWYSTASSTTRNTAMTGRTAHLFWRILKLRDSSISVVPVLDRWVAERNRIERSDLHTCIRKLISLQRYAQALEISFWMTDKMDFQLMASDAAIRLDLMMKVHGIEYAENYFNKGVPKQLQRFKVYSALLRCYVHINSVEKAEALMQRMRYFGLDRGIAAYNNLITLYYKTGNYKKLDTLMHELEERGIAPDVYTYCICLSACAAQGNVDEIDTMLHKVESGSSLNLSWELYSVATDAYMKVGHMDKALAMLKKSEQLIEGTGGAYNRLLTQYATLGKIDGVLRLWELYKTKLKVSNTGYIAMISSLLKFDDVESAEKIIDEWESQISLSLSDHDIRIPNLLLSAYSRKGLLDKFESILNRIRSKGGKPDARTWYFYATGLILQNKMEKAVNAMKEAIRISKPRWKPSEESLAACLKYLKGEVDIDEAEKLINLLVDRDIISSEIQVKLLSYVKDGNVDSTLDGLLMLDHDALHGNGEEADEGSIDCIQSRASVLDDELQRF
ncbi:hypothetical protein CCACVL1_29531 [Corchorus capsularis]|uniref:F-box domain-containing protein n=1 Tax=Corchorus capsularis TaxID=210143 RepID=A0A1R3G1C8_COCAP|nr:hypothetical protein CCACVL1_29531 [Corchorus capsularis]